MTAKLTTHGLGHVFGGLCALDGVNLHIEERGMHAIIGPNGAGKTTIFNLVTGVYRASQGQITFGGHDLVGKHSARINQLGVARTFQNIRLFKNLSAFDNLRIAQFGRMTYSPYEAMTRLFRFHGEEDRVAHKSMELLDTFSLTEFADTAAGSLPYGIQRRLEIARAMATGPQLLLLDEPAAGMNPQEIEQLMTFIQWLREKFALTILLIEHQMKVVMGICDRITVLDFGKVIAEGTPGEIRRNPRVLEAYLGAEDES